MHTWPSSYTPKRAGSAYSRDAGHGTLSRDTRAGYARPRRSGRSLGTPARAPKPLRVDRHRLAGLVEVGV